MTGEQLDQLIALDEASDGPWDRAFQLKYYALIELRARRSNLALDQLTSLELTDSQLDYLIRIGRRNLQADSEAASDHRHQQTLLALSELRELRRRDMDRRRQP